MDWDRRRFDDRRGGESYRPTDRSGRSPSRHPRSPPRNRSPRPRADTWVPPSNRGNGRPRSRSPPYRRRSRTPPIYGRGPGPSSYGRRRSPTRRFSPRRDDKPRSPPAASWRSKSPYSEDRSHDASRGRVSPRRTRDGTPASQDFRASRRDYPPPSRNDRYAGGPSPNPQPTPPLGPPTHRPHSPSSGAPREHSESFNQGPSLSPPCRPSPAYALAAESEATSRRSSPAGYLEKAGLSLSGRSRSPLRPSSPSQRPSRSKPRSPYSQDPVYQTAPSSSARVPETPHFPQSNYDATFPTAGRGQDPDGRGMLRMSDHRLLDQSQMGDIRTSSNIPTQPRSHSESPLPPSGPSQGPKPAASLQSRGSQNMSLLSAPTRPRRGPGSRESSWMGAPLARRVPAPAPLHGAPAGPRGSFTSPTSGGGSYRYPVTRQNSVSSSAQSPVPRFTNHLAGLCTVTPGGRTLPSLLEPVTEKRLTQLEADQVKLLEQIAETQRAKRTGLREWDKLDRESSISALRSELAEGHLQRMADESIGGSILF